MQMKKLIEDFECKLLELAEFECGYMHKLNLKKMD